MVHLISRYELAVLLSNYCLLGLGGLAKPPWLAEPATIQSQIMPNKHSFYIMLTTLFLLPILGAFVLSTMQDISLTDISRIKKTALITTILTFFVSIMM